MNVKTIKQSALILMLMLITASSKAQFVQGYGITVGATYCTQKWEYDNLETYKRKYRWGPNASIFLEMLNMEFVRWISEVQYNTKGAKEVPPPEDTKYKNRLTYLSWNNFIKLRAESYVTTLYLIGGPRLEYRIGSKAQIYPDIIKAFKPFHLSVSGGAGIEFISRDPWIWFLEAQYNPDITDAYRNKDLDNLRIRHRAWEIRVGIKKRITNFEDCP